MKELFKKLNNFRLSSLLMSIGAFVGLISTILALIFYQTSSPFKVTETGEIVNTPTIALQKNQVAGMIFFIFAILIIILGIVVIGKSFKFIFPKQKLLPERSIGWILIAENVLLIGLLSIILFILATEQSRHVAGFTISLVLGFLSVIYGMLWVAPTLNCRFYTPEINLKK